MKNLLGIATALVLAACGASDTAPATETAAASAPIAVSAGTSARAPLPAYLDCVRDSGGVLIAAHRGGPAPGFPENAIETMQHGLDNGLHVFEIDIAESRDGVQFLMHDRTLARTTTGEGAVADTDWSTISGLRLVDNDGKVTAFAPPRFTDVLLWATANGAILELDRKDTTSFRNIISNVRAAGAEDHVIVISYTDEQAGEIARLAPDLMLTAGARGGRDIGRLEQLGVARENLIAWTGTDRPDAPAWARNARESVESAFGTLGRRNERLDDVYWADGDASEYQALIDDGLVLLATDEPYRVAQALSADETATRVCGR